MIKKFFKENPHLWMLLYIPIYLLWFILLEHHVTTDYWVSWTTLDDKIPFIEWFVLAYVLWYPLLFFPGIYMLWKDVPSFKRYMWSIIAGFSICLFVCTVFPNGQDLRPLEMPRDNLCIRMLAGLYNIDTNTNVLPSMHVVGSVLVSLAVCYSPKMKGWRLPVLLLAVLVSLSTVFVKQHSILDVYWSFAVCVPIWFVIYVLGRKKRESRKKQ